MKYAPYNSPNLPSAFDSWVRLYDEFEPEIKRNFLLREVKFVSMPQRTFATVQSYDELEREKQRATTYVFSIEYLKCRAFDELNELRISEPVAFDFLNRIQEIIHASQYRYSERNDVFPLSPLRAQHFTKQQLLEYERVKQPGYLDRLLSLLRRK